MKRCPLPQRYTTGPKRKGIRIQEGKGLNDQIKPIALTLREYYGAVLDWLFLGIQFNDKSWNDIVKSVPKNVTLEKDTIKQFNTKGLKNFQTITNRDDSSTFVRKVNSLHNDIIVYLDAGNGKQKPIRISFELFLREATTKKQLPNFTFEFEAEGFYEDIISEINVVFYTTFMPPYSVGRDNYTTLLQDNAEEWYISVRDKMRNSIGATISHELTHAIRDWKMPNVDDDKYVGFEQQISFKSKYSLSHFDNKIVRDFKFGMYAYQKEELAANVAGASFSNDNYRQYKALYKNLELHINAMKNILKGIYSIRTSNSEENKLKVCLSFKRILLILHKTFEVERKKPKSPLYYRDIEDVEDVMTDLRILHTICGGGNVYGTLGQIDDKTIHLMLELIAANGTESAMNDIREYAHFLEQVINRLQKRFNNAHAAYIKKAQKVLGRYASRTQHPQ